MKKLTIALLFLASFTASAQNSSADIGRVTNFMGVTVMFSVMSSNGNKNLFMCMRGKHGIRKVSTIMKLGEAKRLRDLLDKAISNIEGE